jgi:hypothetical protein
METETEKHYDDQDNRFKDIDSTDAEALGNEASAIDPQTGEYRLVRQLKNRHIAMIRSVNLHSLDVRRITQNATLKYWWGYWNRVVPGYGKCPSKWWSCGYESFIPYIQFDPLRCVVQDCCWDTR